MRVVFLTTYNVTWDHDHFFTKNVSLVLSQIFAEQTKNEFVIVSVLENKLTATQIEEISSGRFDYRQCVIGNNQTYLGKVDILEQYLKNLKPNIIHSNMVEGFDIQAAKNLGIPIFTTVHIGGIICPRGGGNGFLKYDDSICNQPIGNECAKCMAKDLPFPSFSYLLHKFTPRCLKKTLSNHLHIFILYLSAFLRLTTEPTNKKEFLKLAKYTNLIVANRSLAKLFALNGLGDRCILLPHGVVPRNRLPMPAVDSPIKFYFLGRIQYSKGLHVIIKALKGIPHSKYEFHVIGDTSCLGKHSIKYFKKIKHRARDINIFYEGRIANDNLETKIKDYHVMIHSTIFHEVYGIAIAESLSMGRPVLATRCGGAEMQIVDGFNGWLVKPNDVGELRKHIIRLIDNPERINTCAENASLPMSVQDYCKKLIGLYSSKCQI